MNTSAFSLLSVRPCLTGQSLELASSMEFLGIMLLLFLAACFVVFVVTGLRARRRMRLIDPRRDYYVQR